MDDDALDLDPATSALLVVDMQNDFCDPDGYYALRGRNVAPLRAAITPTVRLRDRARDAGLAVVYTRLVHDPAHGPMERRHVRAPRHWTGSGERLLPGSWGAEVVPELRPRPGELVVDKTGYSAFDGTGLQAWLTGQRITTLLLSGVVGYACVLATGFAGFDRNFDIVVASDAVGSWDADLGESALRVVDLLLGYAVPADRIGFRHATAPASPTKGTG